MAPEEMEKIIQKDGWQLARVTGAHHHYKHPTKQGTVTIAFHSRPKDLKSRDVKSILKQAGLAPGMKGKE